MAGDRTRGRESALTWSKVILFGDSLTQQSFSTDGCWGTLVANYLQRKCDVYNRGFSGYTSRLCKVMLPQIITSADVKDVVLLTIFLGANDSNDKELNPKQHVPLDEYKQNLVDIVEYLQSIGVGREKIVLIGPPPVDEETWSKIAKQQHKVISGKTNALTQMYCEGAAQVASQCGTEFVNLFYEMKKVENWETLLADGLHLSSKGSQLLFELLKPSIEKRTDAMPTRFPEWREVDFAKPVFINP